MKPQGVTEEQIKLRAFPFSLADKEDWLFYMLSGSITTWEGLKWQFLEKFFPTSKTANIRKEICGVRQANGEILYEYWERFKQLCASCPHHQIPDQLLIKYFYKGLLPMDRNMVDAASGGILVNKTTDEAKRLILNIAENSQKFGVRSEGVTRRVNEAAKAYGICAAPEHVTDMYPTFQEDPYEQASAIGGLPGPPQRRNDSYASTYNPGWGNHPNFSYAPKLSGFQQPFQQRPPVQQPSASDSGMTFEDMVIPNPKKNASAMLLQSGKEVQSPKSEAVGVEDEQVYGELEKEKVSTPLDVPKIVEINPSFPDKLAKAKKEESEKEILDTFRKVKINIPLLEAIRQLPKYIKFLKGLCTNRHKLNVQDKIKVDENVSAVLQRKLPQKCKDPGMFTVACIIRQKRIERRMLDLGASINIMPLTIFRALNLGPLKDTRVIIQLADRSNVYPEGVVEDVLVKINEFIFPADFYIVDMNDDNSANSAVLLLGRSFISTARTKIDVHEVTLSVEFDGKTVTFNIFYAMKYPDNTESVNYSKMNTKVESVDEEETSEVIMSLHSLPEPPDKLVDSYLPLPTSNERILPSIGQALELELKELPKHLKYAYLGDHDTIGHHCK
nr:uncharacterized protein LOC113704710 [Coffea arabica]